MYKHVRKPTTAKEQLIAAMEKNNISQKQIAEKIGISERFLSVWLHTNLTASEVVIAINEICEERKTERQGE